MKKRLVEAIGTFFLVLVIALTGDPLAIGVVLMVMVYMGGHISGGHYNPAVTLGVRIRGKICRKDTSMYIVSQIVGAALAVGVAVLVGGSWLVPTPAASATVLQAVVIEFLFTFALVLVVLNVATVKATQGNSYFGLAIGLTIFFAAMAGGPISGGAFNPAVGLGPWVVDVIRGGGFSHVWLLYVLAPLAGGAVAGVTANFLHPKG